MSRHPQRLTMARARQIAVNGDVHQLVLHPALVPALLRWLDAHDLDMVPGPQSEGDLFTWITTPREMPDD